MDLKIKELFTPLSLVYIDLNSSSVLSTYIVTFDNPANVFSSIDSTEAGICIILAFDSLNVLELIP